MIQTVNNIFLSINLGTLSTCNSFSAHFSLFMLIEGLAILLALLAVVFVFNPGKWYSSNMDPFEHEIPDLLPAEEILKKKPKKRGDKNCNHYFSSINGYQSPPSAICNHCSHPINDQYFTYCNACAGF